jgi:hypothetical protein
MIMHVLVVVGGELDAAYDEKKFLHAKNLC